MVGAQPRLRSRRPEEIIAFRRAALAGYETPKDVVFVDSLPETLERQGPEVQAAGEATPVTSANSCNERPERLVRGSAPGQVWPGGRGCGAGR